MLRRQSDFVRLLSFARRILLSSDPIPTFIVLEMLLGEKDVNEENVTKLGMIFEFVEAKSAWKQKGKSEENGKLMLAEGKQDESSSSETMTSFATMTFTAICDQSN